MKISHAKPTPCRVLVQSREGVKNTQREGVPQSCLSAIGCIALTLPKMSEHGMYPPKKCNNSKDPPNSLQKYD